MRVLLTNTMRGWSGETAYVGMLAKELKARGFDVQVASRKGSILAEKMAAADIPVTELDLRQNPIGILRDMKRIRRLAREFDPDIVHCNASKDTWICANAFRVSGHRAVRVRTKHNLKPIRSSAFNRMLYQRTLNALIAPSETVLEHLQESPVTQNTPMRCIHNGIELDRFSGDEQTRREARGELLSHFPKGEDPLVAIYMSRLSKRKQPEVAVQAIQSLSGTPVVLAMVGGTESETGQRCIELAANNTNIAFLGFRDDVARLLAGADVFLLPSLHEPFGLAPVEAMACGTVPILPRASSFPHILKNSEAGVLYDPEDQVKGICEALTRLEKNPEELARRSKASLMHAQHFSAEGMTDAVARFYEELLS